jgi:hypothetical protein
MMYKKFAMLMGSSVAIIVLLIVGLSYVKFGVALSPMERNILLFSYDKVKITERKPLMVATLISPVEIVASSKGAYPKVPLSDIAPADKPEEQKVSLILIRGGKKIAVINNLVVREGDSINLGKIAKIEKGGVLIRNKEGEQWLNMN